MTLDLLIENARIVDGTGSPWFRGAVGVADGRIDRVVRSTAHGLEADRVVDADGDVVAPGFVDAHSHSDLRLFEDSTLAPKTRQGITTEVVGQDGLSFAPIYDGVAGDGAAEAWEDYMSGLAGRFEGEWPWESVGEYLAAVDETDVAVDVATLVGHGTARYNVLGFEDVEPTASELEEMADLVAEGLEDGAVGLSTGLVYTPQVYSDTEEVSRLAAELAPYGRPFVAHIRSEGRWIWEAMDEFVDVGAEHDIPIHQSHFKVSGKMQHGKAERALELVETARERGVDMTADQYPYTAGSTMLRSLLPPWIQQKEGEELLAALADEETRERVRRDIEEWRIDGWENVGGKTGWDDVDLINLKSETYGDLEGESVADIAARFDVRPIDTVCDVLIEENLEAGIVAHGMIEEDVRTLLASDRVAVCTDGLFGARPHPRVYGSFPRILGTYVREENLLSLEAAVRKMTALPARVYGLDSKGLVRPGMDADLVVFDPDVVESRATFDRPARHPLGIDHVFVDGTAVVADGELTGATPGGAIYAGD